MEPKGSLVEHIYAEIKREICSGSVRPGERIDVAGLCKRFGSSKSPVRSALYWLVGENLLELHAHDGFYRPRLTKDSAEDLYSWYEDQVLMALAKAEAKSTGDTPPPPLPQDPEDLVEATEVLFEAVARLSGSQEYVHVIQNGNDRLRAIRRVKPADLIDRRTELASLTDAWNKGDFGRLRQEITAYHRRRLTVIPSIMMAAYSGT